MASKIKIDLNHGPEQQAFEKSLKDVKETIEKTKVVDEKYKEFHQEVVQDKLAVDMEKKKILDLEAAHIKDLSAKHFEAADLKKVAEKAEK